MPGASPTPERDPQRLIVDATGREKAALDPLNLSGLKVVRVEDMDSTVAADQVSNETLIVPPVTNQEGQLTSSERLAFHQRISMVGYGVYGRAIHARLGNNFDVVAWERSSAHGDHDDRVTNDLRKAIEGRGLLILAVPSNAFPSVLDKICPHSDTVVVSLAKGLIVPDWNPLESEETLRNGPSEGSRALTPLEYIRQHPNWIAVANNLVFVAGPGFAKDVQSGGWVGLTVSDRSRGNQYTEALQKAFWVFSGMSGDKGVEVYDNSTSLEIASSMKNVAAFAAGIVLGILKKNGALESDETGRFKVTRRVPITHGAQEVMLDEQTLHRLSNFASREIINVVKSEGGGKGAQLTFAGNHDLNLTVNSLTSRNVQAGMRLACGENIYDILTHRENGHALTAEGVIATHAMARRIQNNNKTEAFAPLVFALRNILMNRSTPEDIMAHYFLQTNEWTNRDAHRFFNGTSKPMGLLVHGEGKPHID